MVRESVVIVWDSDGKFFQIWTSKYHNGDGIKHGISVAKIIKGTYKILSFK